ncbi:MAG TPA: LamG-like jellyroll fold domain-containing protein, partial [Bacteroidota bacterium]|nr:LamG-like jellyroll fold domain-containing protein [Bacteroidota bacterium]
YIMWNGSPGNGYSLQLDPSNNLYVAYEGNLASTEAGQLSVGAWTHLAAVHSGPLVVLYVNGVGDTVVNGGTVFAPTTYLQVGGTNSGPYSFNGQITEVRVSTVARYTSNFTPPSSPFSPDQFTVTLYHFQEGTGQTVNDASQYGNNGQLGSTSGTDSNDPSWSDSYPVLNSNQGYQIDCESYNSTAKYVTANLPTTTTGDVTLEAWVFWQGPNEPGIPPSAHDKSHTGTPAGTPAPSAQTILINGNTGANGYGIFYALSGTTYYLTALIGGVAIPGTGITLDNGSWDHVVVESRSGNWWVYKNGVGDSLGAFTPITPSGALYIGANQSALQPFYGWIDEVRISNVARYNENFTPQVWPFTPDAQTAALYHFDEGSGQEIAEASGNGFTAQNGSTSGVDVNDISWATGLAPLPITLSSFGGNVTASNGNVSLQWTTQSETNSYGYYVQRSQETLDHKPGSWSIVSALIPGAGTSLAEHNYTWTDNGVAAGTYFYRLKEVALNGSSSFSSPIQIIVTGVTGVKDSQKPLTFMLGQNYPNPFNPTSQIAFELPQEAAVTLTVSNILGQTVAILLNNERISAGEHSATFDGSALPSGEYIYRITAIGAKTYNAVRKMMLIK